MKAEMEITTLDGEVITTEDLKEIEDPVMIEITPEGVVVERLD